MPSKYFKCIVPGCGNNGEMNPQEVFFQLPKTMTVLEKWAKNMNLPDVVHKPESSRRHYKVCRMHFDDSCFQTPEKKKLNRGVVPTIFNFERDLVLPEVISPEQEAKPVRSDEILSRTQAVPEPSKNRVISGHLPTALGDKKDTIPRLTPVASKMIVMPVGIREVVKGSADTTANSKESSKPVESNENDLQTQSDKLVEEPEVTPAPILFVSSSAGYKEEVLKTSNKQPDTDCDPFKKRIVQNPRDTGHTGKCKIEDVESQMERERNLARNEVSVLRKKVDILQNQNRRLDRRVKSMKTLLRHYKKTHA